MTKRSAKARRGDGPKTTLRDVAELAGVHPATVSRVLAPETRRLVNDKTAQRVDEAIAELGYLPNPVARGLRTKRTTTIGVVLNDLTNPLFPPILVGIEDRLLESGYTSLIADSKGIRERMESAFETLSTRQVDGFILTTALREDPLVEDAVGRNVPVVLAVRTIDSGAAPAVIFDDSRGMRRAVRHLVELGHRDIVHIAGPQAISNGHRRREAFIASMADHGHPAAPDQIILADGFTLEAGEKAFRELLDSGQRCTAVIASNDLIAIGGYAVLAECGIECPRDISIIGFNDMPLADRLSPSLTSLHVPHYHLGVQAADLLLERLRDPSAPVREITVEEDLIVRDSTAPPPAERF